MPRVVSIIVCTRNRADSLRETLASISRCAVPTDVEVDAIVVDNGSTDHTPEVMEATTGAAFAFRLVRESRPGLSRARNRGIAASRGDVLLWTDDDVRVPTTWIEAMARPVLSGRADAVAGEVRIPPHLIAAVRGTALQSRLGFVASTHGVDFSAPTRMVGANMAFSRRVLDTVRGFDERLGPGPEALGFFDETLFSAQLSAAGLRIAGVAGDKAAVIHHFDPSRICDAEVIRMSRSMGRSAAYFDRARGVTKARWTRAYLIILNLQFLYRCLVGALRLSPSSAVTEARVRRAWKVGYLREVLALRSAQ